MKRFNNCCKLLIVFFLLTGATAQAQDKELLFTVDTGTSTGTAAIKVEAPEGSTWTAVFTRVEDGISTETLTSVTETVTTEPLILQLPQVDKDLFIEAAVLPGSDPQTTPSFTWRTLARPAGQNLMDYSGTKSLLPPDDFDDYWKRAAAELDATTSNPRVTREPDQDTTTGLLFRVELDSVENTTIVGWMYVPRSAYAAENPDAQVLKKYPAVILFPGYNGNMRPVDRTRDGYITLSVNPRNHGPSRSFWKSPVEHQLYNITNPESYYYKLAILDCLQATRFLLGRDEVDQQRVGVEGSSQGAYLSIAIAALEPRIACVVANVLAFSDYPDGMNLATRGHHVRLRELLSAEDTSKTLVQKSIAYTDGVNLITRVKAPTQINMGGVDPVSPYVTGIVAHNRLPGGVEKSFYVDPGAAHEVSPIMRKRTREWQDQWLKSEDSSDKKE